MKKLPILLALIASPLFAEPPMLIERDAELNYFLSVNMEFSEVNNESAQFAGLEMGANINQNFDLGFGIYGLIHDVDLDEVYGLESMQEWDMWYTGALFGWHCCPHELVEVSFSAMLGAGWAELTREGGGDGPNIDYFLLRPSLDLTWNLTETIEFGGGFGYRLMEGSDNSALKDDDAGGLFGRLFFRLNEF